MEPDKGSVQPNQAEPDLCRLVVSSRARAVLSRILRLRAPSPGPLPCPPPATCGCRAGVSYRVPQRRVQDLVTFRALWPHVSKVTSPEGIPFRVVADVA